MNQAHILKRPIISEKSTQKTSQNKFVFAVAKQATKKQIKQAVENTFDVTVKKVNTMIVNGKTRRQGKARHQVQTSSWKKAIIELNQGDKIDLFDIKENK